MKRRLTYLLLVSMTLMALVGCGNKKETDSTKPVKPKAKVTKTISKDEVSIAGDFGKAKQVDFTEVKDTTEFKTVASFGDIITGFACYDISMKDAKNKEVQPDGTVKVSVNLSESLRLAPGDTYEVLYTNGDKVARVNSEVNGDKITFETTHFSVYSIVKFLKENKAAVATIANIPQDKNKETMVEVKAVKHEHIYTETISKAATCVLAGEKTITCSCGDSRTEVIAPTGHTFANYKYNNNATYEKDGTETGICSVCGVKDTRTKVGTKLVKQASKPTTPTPVPTPTTPINETEEEMFNRVVAECGFDFESVNTEGNTIWYYMAEINTSDGCMIRNFPSYELITPAENAIKTRLGMAEWPTNDNWRVYNNYLIKTIGKVTIYKVVITYNP